jgi:hypothetical protein
MIEATSSAATVRFDGQAVTIDRPKAGFVDRGTRTIPIGQITAIQWKAPTALRGGYLKFLIAGTQERQYNRSSMFMADVLKDPDAVLVGNRNKAAFEALRAAIEQAISQQQAGYPQPAPAAGGSLADELAKLQQLVQMGALTPAEFEQAKARLLN